jgi:hypothetical protein
MYTGCQEEELLMRGKKGGRVTAVSEDDSDSDRPPWAGGNTDANTHSKGNTDTGVPKGMDYGDLYKLYREPINGVPILTEIGGNYYVQPVDEFGNPLELNEEGELVDPEAADEVEFGRLNIVRAPQGVLDAGFNEALRALADADEVILDFCGRLTAISRDPDTGAAIIIKTIDSPRENLAIFQYLMKYLFEDTSGGNELAFLKGFGINDPLMVASACYAAGSDKTDIIDIDELVYMNGFIDGFGLNPVENTGELDAKGEDKLYFNFGDIYEYGNESFSYDRESTFSDRYIQFAVWDGQFYGENGPIFSIYEYMIGGTDITGQLNAGGFKFTYGDGDLTDGPVGEFTKASDDALQVLELVHEDTNIRWLPEFEPAL